MPSSRQFLKDFSKKEFKRVATRLKREFHAYVLRDEFCLAHKRWLACHGDEKLRLNYPLTSSSVVLDVGGYRGDFAEAIFDKFGCRVLVFEPVPRFFQEVRKRFAGNDRVVCLNYGLSNNNKILEIADDEDSSSVFRKNFTSPTLEIELKKASEAFRALGLDQVDLIKINTEGGEFEILPDLIESGTILAVKFLQVQFRNFVREAHSRREEIRLALTRSHSEEWNFPFVWESWSLKHD